jgi:hypothetical protein
MKKRLALVLFIATFLLCRIAMATDYLEIKGDYKTLCLGDTKEIVLEKVKHLDYTGEINKSNDFPASYFTVKGVFEDIRETNVSLQYYQDRLYEIKLWSRYYSALDVDGAIKHILLKRIKPLFIELYGEPVKEYKYPDFTKVLKQDQPIVVWNSGEKIITLLVEKYQSQYGPVILIQDKALLMLKEKTEQQAFQETQKQIKGDF